MSLVEVSFTTRIVSDHASIKDTGENGFSVPTELEFGTESGGLPQNGTFLRFGPLNVPPNSEVTKAKLEWTHSNTFSAVGQFQRQINITSIEADGIWNTDENTGIGFWMVERGVEVQMLDSASSVLADSSADYSSANHFARTTGIHLGIAWRQNMGETVEATAGTVDKLSMALMRGTPSGGRPSDSFVLELWSLDENTERGKPVAKLAETDEIPFNDVTLVAGTAPTTTEAENSIDNPFVADLLVPFEVEMAGTWYMVKIAQATWSGNSTPRLMLGTADTTVMDDRACDGVMRNFSTLSGGDWQVFSYMTKFCLPHYSADTTANTARDFPRHFGIPIDVIHDDHVTDTSESFGDFEYSTDHTVSMGLRVEQWLASDGYADGGFIAFNVDPHTATMLNEFSMWGALHGSSFPKLTFEYIVPGTITAEGLVSERVEVNHVLPAERVRANEARVKARVFADNTSTKERVRFEDGASTQINERVISVGSEAREGI